MSYNKAVLAFYKEHRPEKSFIFLLLGTGIVLVLFSIYPIVPHAPVS